MSEDVKIKTSIGQNSHFQDRQQATGYVDPTDEESIKKWAEVLHLSQDELLVAVKLYGARVRDIRWGLKKEKKAA